MKMSHAPPGVATAVSPVRRGLRGALASGIPISLKSACQPARSAGEKSIDLSSFRYSEASRLSRSPAAQLRLVIGIVKMAVGAHQVTDADRAAFASDPLCQCIARSEHFARRGCPRPLTHIRAGRRVGGRELFERRARRKTFGAQHIVDVDMSYSQRVLKPARDRISRDQKGKQDTGEADLRFISTALTDPGAEVMKADHFLVQLKTGRIMTSRGMVYNFDGHHR